MFGVEAGNVYSRYAFYPAEEGVGIDFTNKVAVVGRQDIDTAIDKTEKTISFINWGRRGGDLSSPCRPFINKFLRTR